MFFKYILNYFYVPESRITDLNDCSDFCRDFKMAIGVSLPSEMLYNIVLWILAKMCSEGWLLVNSQTTVKNSNGFSEWLL